MSIFLQQDRIIIYILVFILYFALNDEEILLMEPNYIIILEYYSFIRVK